MTRRDKLMALLREGASTDFGQAMQDAILYGIGITQDGKRIDPRDYRIDITPNPHRQRGGYTGGV